MDANSVIMQEKGDGVGVDGEAREYSDEWLCGKRDWLLKQGRHHGMINDQDFDVLHPDRLYPNSIRFIKK